MWDTDVCFLHIQLMETNVRLPKIHKIPLRSWFFESSKSPAKSKSWNKPKRQCWAVFPTWQHCRQSLVWWMYEINLAKRLSQACVHLMTARASWITDQESQVYHFVPSTNISRQFATILLIIIQLIQVPPVLNWWSSKQGLETLCNLLRLFVCQFAVSLNTFLSMSFNVAGPRNRLCVMFSTSW